MDTPPLPDPFKAANQRHADQVSQQKLRLDQLKTALNEKGILLDHEYETLMGTETKIWRSTNKVTNQTFSLDTADIQTFITTGEPRLHDLLATVLALHQEGEERLERLTLTEENATVDEDELAVRFYANHRQILKTMLRLGAKEPAIKKTQKEIIPPPDDYNRFKREFSELRKKGYLLPLTEDKTTRGRWLSKKGIRAAEWLNTKPELD